MAPRRQGLAAWSHCLKLSSYHTGLWPLVSTMPLFNSPNRARSLYQTERVLHTVRYLLSSPGLAFSAVIVSQSRGRRPLACARRTAYQPIPVKMTAESPSTVLPSGNWRTDSAPRLFLYKTARLAAFLRSLQLLLFGSPLISAQRQPQRARFPVIHTRRLLHRAAGPAHPLPGCAFCSTARLAAFAVLVIALCKSAANNSSPLCSCLPCPESARRMPARFAARFRPLSGLSAHAVPAPPRS